MKHYLLSLSFVLCVSLSATAQTLPYQNPNLSAKERAKDLCGRLTLEEKAMLMLDESPAIPVSASRSSSGGAKPCMVLPIWATSPYFPNR